MPLIPLWLEKNIESISKLITFATKIGILIGGFIFIFYSLKIRHFPQGLSAGDVIHFLMTTLCFGMFTLLLIAGLFSSAYVLTFFCLAIAWIISLGFNFASRLFSCLKFSARWLSQIKQIHSFLYGDPNFLIGKQSFWKVLYHLLIALFYLIILVLTYDLINLIFKPSNFPDYILLLTLSLFVFVCHAVYRAITIKIIDSIKKHDPFIYHESKKNFAKQDDSLDLYKTRNSIVLLFFIIPLMLSGKFDKLVDSSMNAVHIRIENALVFVKEPYSTLFTNTLVLKNKVSPKDYKAFDKVDILFKGIGNTTVISFIDGDMRKQLEIPNDSIIVEEAKMIENKIQ